MEQGKVPWFYRHIPINFPYGVFFAGLSYVHQGLNIIKLSCKVE